MGWFRRAFKPRVVAPPAYPFAGEVRVDGGRADRVPEDRRPREGCGDPPPMARGPRARACVLHDLPLARPAAPRPPRAARPEGGVPDRAQRLPGAGAVLRHRRTRGLGGGEAARALPLGLPPRGGPPRPPPRPQGKLGPPGTRVRLREAVRPRPAGGPAEARGGGAGGAHGPRDADRERRHWDRRGHHDGPAADPPPPGHGPRKNLQYLRVP